MWRVAGRAATALSLSLSSASAHAPAEYPPETSAVFGRVRVYPRHLSAAIAEGTAAHLAARRILALPDARFDIAEAATTTARWGDVSPSGDPIYVWRFASPDGRVIPPPAYLLRHEIGHDLFVRYLVPNTRRDQYGGDAPDWLDETAAVAFERDDLRATRRRAAARYAGQGTLIPLARFLTMIHPEAATSVATPDDGTTRAFEATSEDTAKFYAMAGAFHDFLVARTGNRAVVADLAAVVRHGDPLAPWIIDRTGHRRARRGLRAVEADFVAWIAIDARHGGGAGR